MKGILSSTVFDNFASRCKLGKPVARKRSRVEQHVVESDVNKKQKQVPAEQPPAISTCGSLEYQDSKAIVSLRKGQMVALEGCAMVSLLEGSASMHGYSLSRGVEMLVYSSSKLSSALTFESSQDQCKLQFSSYNLEAAGYDDSLSFQLKLFDGAGESRKRKMSWEEAERRIRPTLTPVDWSSAADSVLEPASNPPVVPICGVKGVGKSTFARFLVNKLLSRYKAVAYLDADVGQPEFTIPGCLSLHQLKEPIVGPPASHLRHPERCFFYGDVSPKLDPGVYTTYFKALFDWYKDNYKELPLVINLPGWRTGAGYELLIDILSLATPTHVVEFEHERSNMLPLTPACPLLQITSVTASEVACGTPTAAELRGIRVVSYFASTSGAGECFSVAPAYDEAAETLATQAPYQVSVDDFKIQHLHAEVPASQCLFSLNAQLVGLGISSASTELKLVPCVGFGIVQGVDASKRLLEILTPCSPEVLEKVDTILHGRVDIPAALLEVEGMDDCPYLCRNRVLDGTGSSIFRRGQNILAATTRSSNESSD